MNIKCVFVALHCAELTATGLRDCHAAGPGDAVAPAGFSSVGPSSSYFSSANLILHTVNTPITPCPEYRVSAAMFNLRKAKHSSD